MLGDIALKTRKESVSFSLVPDRWPGLPPPCVPRPRSIAIPSTLLSLLPESGPSKLSFPLADSVTPAVQGSMRRLPVWAIPHRARPESREGCHSMPGSSERKTEKFNWLNAKFLDSLSFSRPRLKCAIFQRLGGIRASIAGSRNLSKGALHEKN